MAAWPEIDALFAIQHGVIGRGQALRLGLTRHQIETLVRRGQWFIARAGVYGLRASPPSHLRDLMAVCLAAPAAVASHLSAAWLLGMSNSHPTRPVVTVGLRGSHQLRGVTVHRSRDLDRRRVLVRKGIPYTDPLRVICDLAAELPASELIEMIDAVVASRLVPVEGLLAEADRRSVRGRKGPSELRALLRQRGLAAGPPPSVLEARVLRLFRRHGIPVLGREVHWGAGGRYRIDFLIAPGLIVEVDGWAYHWSPEAKAYGETRRNEIEIGHQRVLVYSWWHVVHEPGRIVDQVRRAVAA